MFSDLLNQISVNETIAVSGAGVYATKACHKVIAQNTKHL
jgi:hypothetical protein